MLFLVSEAWNGGLAWSFRVKGTVALMTVTTEKLRSVGEKRLFLFNGTIKAIQKGSSIIPSRILGFASPLLRMELVETVVEDEN
jgi:hypothetical protein